MIADDYSIIEATSTADPINVPISWDFAGLTELEVTIQDNTLGTIYKYTDGDFTVTLNQAGDEVDCENPLGSGNSVDVKVYRISPKTQTYGPNENEQLDADALESALDRAVKLNQEIAKTFLDSAITSANAFEVPDKVARVGKVLTFDSGGDPDFQTTADLFADGIGYATEWANKAEDSLVSTAAGGDGADDYSALHHSAKANAQRVLAETAVTDAQAEVVNAQAEVANAQAEVVNAQAQVTLAQTAKTAAELAQTNAETAETNAAASAASIAASASEITSLRTLSGTSASANDLGTFTGATISDNVTVKAALQALETALEAGGSGGGYLPTAEESSDTDYTIVSGDMSKLKKLPSSSSTNRTWTIDPATLNNGDEWVTIYNETASQRLLLEVADDTTDTFLGSGPRLYLWPGNSVTIGYVSATEIKIISRVG